MMQAILLALGAGILLFDFRKNLKPCSKLQKAAYLSLLFFGLTILMLVQYGVAIPSPAAPIESIFKPLVGMR